MTLGLAALAFGLLLTVAGSLFGIPAGGYGDLQPDVITTHIVWLGLAGLVYLAAVWLVRHRPAGRAAMAVILITAVAARLPLLVAPPSFSTDLYRYVWDGRVQAAGINPYRYIPADPALTALRDVGTGPAAIYENINRPDYARTIYPPVAQLFFALVGRVASSVWGMKAAITLLDLATAGLLLLILRAAGRPAAHVLIWAWNPLVIWEFSGAAHIDALACAFIALALLLAIRARAGWAGAALGAAIATKFLPAVLFPAIWRRWDWRGPVAALAVLAGGYAVYASVGWNVFGFLGGYTAEENLRSGSGFLVLRLAEMAGPLPGWAGAAYAAAALTVLATLGVVLAWRPLPSSAPARAIVIGRAAVILAAALTVLLSPHYPWYMTLVIVPAVVAPAWSVLWFTVAAPLLYMDFYDPAVWIPAAVFLPPFALLLFDLLLRSPDRPRAMAELTAKGG